MQDLILVLENFVGGTAAVTVASQMKKWGKRVPSAAKPVVVVESLPAVIPSGHLSIAGFSIKQDAEGRYCLNDLHRASGGIAKDRPSEWLKNKKTQELISEINGEDGNPSSEHNQVLSVIRGGDGVQGTFVTKKLVYHYAMWISPKFCSHVIDAYDALVTGQLSPPRNSRVQLLLENSKKMIEDLREGFQAALEREEALVEKLTIAEPKALLVDKLKVFTVGQVVQYINAIQCVDMTAEKLSNVLSLYGYLTPSRRVPARKQWGRRWFGFGLVDVINQDGDLVSSSGEEYFITEAGLEGIMGLLESMDWWERNRLGLGGEE